MISAFIGLFAVNATIQSAASQFDFLSTAMAVILLLIVIVAILKFLYFRYQLLEDGIQIRQGIFFKKHLNLKFKRIQNVNIRHPFYFRPIELVTLKIDGAGAKNEEVNLAALTLDTAKAIRKTVQIKKGQLGSNSAGDGVQPVSEGEIDVEKSLEEELFYTRSFADLVIHGLTNNRAWIIVGGLAGFLQSTPFSVSDAIDWLQQAIGSLISNESIAYTVMLVSISFVLAIALTALFSVLGSIIAYYGFTLYHSDKSLMVHRGLINKQEINMQKSRVQSVYFRQDWLDLVLKRVNVIYEQITHTEHDAGTIDNSKKILVPSAREWERGDLAREVFTIPDIGMLKFQAISKRYFYKHTLIWSIIYSLIAMALVADDTPTPLVIAPLWLAHIFMIYLTWLRAGLVLVNDYIIVRKGLIGIDYIIFPAYKLQAVDHVQSLLMRRRDLSNIIFHIASRTAKVSYLPTQYVKDILDYCLYSLETNDRSWM